MKILAIDSSTAKATVSLYVDGNIAEKIEITDSKTHSETLVPMIQQVLQKADTKPADVDYYAASIGPGSFTGLRIGVVTIKSIAMAVSKPCVAVPTLDALAYNVHEFDGIICPLIDARNDQVFTAIYEGAPMPKRLSDYMAKSVVELALDLKQLACGKPVLLVGDGAEKHVSYLTEQLAGVAVSCALAPLEKRLADSASVAFVAAHLAGQGQVTDCDALVPEYLRKSSAEQAKERAERALAQEGKA